MKLRTPVPVLAGLAQAAAVTVYVLLFSLLASILGPMIGMRLDNGVVAACLFLMTLSLSVFVCSACVAAYPVYLLVGQKNVRNAAMTVVWTGIWMALILAFVLLVTITM